MDDLDENEIRIDGKLMSELFEEISRVVGLRLAELSNHNLNADYDNPDPNVFRNEEYLKQNIRVSPERLAEPDLFSLRSRHHGESIDSDNEEKKYNRDAKLDLDSMREQVKAQYEAYVARVERELEEQAKREGKDFRRK
jgi:hypothetical protein